MGPADGYLCTSPELGLEGSGPRRLSFGRDQRVPGAKQKTWLSNKIQISGGLGLSWPTSIILNPSYPGTGQ